MEESSENVKQATRIQTSLLARSEKRLITWIAGKFPKWVTSDMLTWFGVFGAVVSFVGYALVGITGNYNWFWLASLGIFLHWFGDSHDGTLARVRKQQRKLYGYYIDHNLDCIAEFFIFVGIACCGLCYVWLPLIAFIFYLQLEVYVAINAHIKKEFKLTYAKMGPTEFRIIIIICNILFTYVPAFHEGKKPYTICGFSFEMQLFDWIGLGICIVLMVIYLVSFFSDLRYFDKIDPLVKSDDAESK